MAQGITDVVRRFFDGLARGELLMELVHPEVVIENNVEFPIRGPYRGLEGVRRWWQDLEEAFDQVGIVLEELAALDDEVVLTEQRLVGRFRSTQIQADTPWASLMTVRDGKIAQAIGYSSAERARRAAAAESEPT